MPSDDWNYGNPSVRMRARDTFTDGANVSPNSSRYFGEEMSPQINADFRRLFCQEICANL